MTCNIDVLPSRPLISGFSLLATILRMYVINARISLDLRFG